MGQSLDLIEQEINSLKDILKNGNLVDAFEFAVPANLIAELKVDSRKVQFYWDIDCPKVILSSSNGQKLIESWDIEGIPKECLSNREYLRAFLQQNYVHISNYNNSQEYKLRFSLKLLGGAIIVDPDKAPSRLWPNATIPIFVNCNTFNSNGLKNILSAINDWASKTLFTFKVHFTDINEKDFGLIYRFETPNLHVSCSVNLTLPGHQQRRKILLYDWDPWGDRITRLLKKEPEYQDSILIQKYTPECMRNPVRDRTLSCTVCQSPVGRQGGQQLISCKLGQSFGEKDLKHEIGHAIGFYHEQQRSDRDAFVKAPNRGNYDPNYGIEFQSGIRKNFSEYDFKSIMHYFFGEGIISGRPIIMEVQQRIPVEQYRQLVELGEPEYRAPFLLSSLDTSQNYERMRNGLLQVGKTGNLSENDIEAANYLANKAIAKRVR